MARTFTCAGCGQTKEAASRGPLPSWCRECGPTYHARYYRNNRHRWVESHRRRYGLAAEAARALEESQGGRCAACGDQPDSLVVDHDHETGAVRGLLCPGCNIGLGHFRDDPDRLRAAAEYLERRHEYS